METATGGGRYRSVAEIAEAEKIGRSFVNRLLQLTLLAPDIQEAILEGWQREGLTARRRSNGLQAGITSVSSDRAG